MNRKASFLLSFLLFFGAAMAENVTSEQASRAVSRWLKSNRSLEQNIGKSVKDVRTLSANGTDIHVVRLAGGGFVVTSADTGIEPIICYSSSDDLIEDDRNQLWAMLCHDLPARAKYAQERRRTTTRSTATYLTEEEQQWAELLQETRLKSSELETSGRADIRVEPLIASKWGQEDGIFNYYTPNKIPCGCVATALAQVMRYHRFPTQSVEAKTYPCKVHGKDTALTTMGGIYDWNNMPLTVDGNTSEIEVQAIGKLTYDCGVVTRMAYTYDGSGTFGWYAVDPLINLFGYADAHSYYSGSDLKSLDMEVVRPLILSNLDAGYPVLMGIHGGGSHEIVGDGYGFDIITKALYLHVNMGFSGKEDAWYLWPKMSNYSNVMDIVYNIMPDKKGQILSGRVTDKNGLPIRDAEVVVMATDNDAIIDRVSTNSKGIFAFVLPGGVKYRLTATSQGKSKTILTGELHISVDLKIDYNNRGYFDTTNMQAGNSWGNDIRMADIELSVLEPLVIADTLPAGEEFTPYRQTITVKGGLAPYYFFPSNVPYTEDCTEACTFDADRGVTPFNSDEHFSVLTDGNELITLPFKFPYFGELVESVKVSRFGSIYIGVKDHIEVAGGAHNCKAEDIRIQSSHDQFTLQWKDYASITLYSNGKMRVSYGNLIYGEKTSLWTGDRYYDFDIKPDFEDYAYANDLVITPPTPSGFSINELTGEVSGLPRQAGKYTFHVNVIDSEQQIVSKDIVIEIKPSLNEQPVITSLSPAQKNLLLKRGTVTHFEMQATDTETADSDLVYRWYLDDKFVGTGNAYDYTATIDDLWAEFTKERIHTLSCSVSDDADENRVSHSWLIRVNAGFYIDANYVSDIPDKERQGTADEPFSAFGDNYQYGDTLYFRPGTYDVAIMFSEVSMLVSTDGPEQTFLKSADGITQLFDFSPPTKVVIEGFTITGPADNAMLSGGTFVNCRIIDNQLPEDALDSPFIIDAVLKDCIISGNVGAAMTGTKLYNCQVINNENGIDASCEAYNTLFWNNSVCDAEEGAILENCTFDVQPSGIHLIPNSVRMDGDIYDLLGRKVKKISKSGFYLIGNKKQYVRP